VLLRRFFSVQIPDPTISAACCSAPDLLGDAARPTVAPYHGDLVLGLGRPALEAGDRRVRTLVAVRCTVQTYTLLDKVTSTYNEQRADLRSRPGAWPFSFQRRPAARQ